MQIDGISALVTGGASGLGEATVRALVGRGAKVTIVDRDAKRGPALAEELGSATQFAQTDVTDPESVAAAVAMATEFGPLRAVVNSAGIGWAQRIISKTNDPHDLSPFETVIQINLIGSFNVMRFAASAMAKTEVANEDNERGVIINTASVAAFDGQIGQIAYSASKGGVVGMTLPAARDLSAVGVRVNCIAPGTFDTPLLGLLPPEQRQALAANIPFPKRLGNPTEYAALALHMIENSYLNAQTVRLDGAIRMPPKG
jgi:NAD(P)-dependent dehydrogenase (short-subunit alcohol dehydrogenase family)